VVVGAGPAGVRAAQALVQAGVRPTVVDEGQRDGGQIYRRQPVGFTRPYTKLYGSEASKAEALHRDFDALRPQIDYRSRTLAWNLTAGALHVVRDDDAHTLPFDALIVCAGATDRLMPVPGWQRAGCYSLGAAQIALKAQACAIGTRCVFMGSGPLLYLVASQYLQAGVSARRPMQRGLLPWRSVPTTPVPARPSCTSSPSRRSALATTPAVRRSSNASSGWACRSRRSRAAGRRADRPPRRS
jgi:NADPH-dependent 2,4-dienoyl-CoA reductase/sulfur reductase-like enzyme